VDPTRLEEIPFIKGEGFTLLLLKSSAFLESSELWCLLSASDNSVEVHFRIEDVDTSRIVKVLQGKVSPGEVELLKGMSLVGRDVQSSLMHLFLRGELDAAKVAEKLLKHVGRLRKRERALTIIDWLRRNGFERVAAEAVIKYALL